MECVVLSVVGLFRRTLLCSADRTTTHGFFMTYNLVNISQQGSFFMSHSTELLALISVTTACLLPGLYWTTTMLILLQSNIRLIQFCLLMLSLCCFSSIDEHIQFYHLKVVYFH